jgi:hypothetical protein
VEEAATDFKRDLHSATAKKVYAELRRFHLPTLEDIRDEFDAQARELDVRPLELSEKRRQIARRVACTHARAGR